MDNTLPPAEELLLVDRELARLDARRAQLLARRAWLLSVLHPPRPPFPGHAPAVAPAEASPRGAQNALLMLGGVLLAIAALAFTLVSWGSMGIGGRAAVLLAVTSAALAAPVVLARRGLMSTAESVGALGLVLTVLDAYALRRVALPGTDGLGYAAVASGVLAGVWAGYGAGLPRLRVPLPAAVAAAQLPLPLGAAAAGGGPVVVAWAALVTAAADLLLVRHPAVAVRLTAGVSGAALTAGALVTGGGFSLTEPWPGAALLAAGAALCLYAAGRAPAGAVALSAVAGLAAVAAVGGLLRAALPASWTVVGYTACGLAAAWLWPGAVRVAVADRLPRAVRTGAGAVGAGVVALGAVWALPPVAAGLLGPLGRGTPVWSGRHTEPPLGAYPATALVVLLLAGAALAVVPRVWARCGALLACWALLTALPVSLGLPYGATLAVGLVTSAGALAVGVRAEAATRGLGAAPAAPAAAAGAAQGWGASWPGPGAAVTVEPRVLAGWVAFAAGLGSAVPVVALALDVRSATFVVLAALLGVYTAAAVAGAGGRRAVASCAAVLAAAGLVASAAVAAGLAVHGTGLALLLVPAGTAALAARVRSVPVEATGAAVGLVALACAAARPAVLALALALAGVVAAATALRAERRRAASWTAGVLLLLAAWVRLGVWGVAVPEAYTLPVTVPALVVGFLRRRRDPAASSWIAYGPGLAATLVPGLVAVWAEPGWPRPLLLGAGALAVTLLGARFRLQAPLVLGGAALVLVGLHEAAPHVARVVGALPRWLPPAVAGLLLLAVGATYERRLADARRLRERLGRMR